MTMALRSPLPLIVVTMSSGSSRRNSCRNIPPSISAFSANFSSSRTFHRTRKRKKNVKSFPNHKAHRAALISVSLALSQTPVYTARPRIRSLCIARCACLRPQLLLVLIAPTDEGKKTLSNEKYEYAKIQRKILLEDALAMIFYWFWFVMQPILQNILLTCWRALILR